MSELILNILPLGISSAISPTQLLFLLVILSSSKLAVKRSLYYLLGCVVGLLILGLFVLITLHISISPSLNDSKLFSAIFYYFLALLIAYLTLRLFVFPKRKKEDKLVKEEKSSFIKDFFLGIGLRVLSMNTIFPFIAASKEIIVSDISILSTILVYFVLLTISMAPLYIIEGIYFAAGKNSEKILSPLQRFMKKNSNTINIIISVIIFIYLAIKGTEALI